MDVRAVVCVASDPVTADVDVNIMMRLLTSTVVHS